MPRSFLVKKKTKGKDERTPSCDVDGQVVSSQDAVVEDTHSQRHHKTPTTGATTLDATLQNNAENIAHGASQRELQKSPSVQLLSFSG